MAELGDSEVTRAVLMLASLVLVAGCKTTRDIPVEVQIKTVEVAVRAPCPDPVERTRLKSLRPDPLRNTPMPATAAERVAKSTAQLGRYEARGAWADQVDAVLDRCQQK